MSADVEDFSRLCTKNSMLTWLLLDAVVTVLRYWINTDLISLAIKKQSSSSVHFQQQTKKLLAMQYPWFIYNAGKKDSRLSQHLESFSPTFIWVLGPKTLFSWLLFVLLVAITIWNGLTVLGVCHLDVYVCELETAECAIFVLPASKRISIWWKKGRSKSQII